MIYNRKLNNIKCRVPTSEVVGVGGVRLVVVEEGVIAQHALHDPGRLYGCLKLECARCRAYELRRHVVADVTQVDHLRLLARANEHLHLEIHDNKISIC